VSNTYSALTMIQGKDVDPDAFEQGAKDDIWTEER
jgi:hypothetical protein